MTMKEEMMKLLIAVSLLTSLPLVFAEHEANHRYTISGYIRDVNGNPLANVEVVAVDMNVGIAEKGFTDKNGKYNVLLHLHDENLGDDLTITALGISYQAEAIFDPRDATTERGLRLDLTGDKWMVGEFEKAQVDIKSACYY